MSRKLFTVIRLLTKEHSVTMNKKISILLIVSLALNLFLTAAAVILIKECGIFNISDSSDQPDIPEQTVQIKRSYLDNPQYGAYVSAFDLSKRSHARVVFCGDSITMYGRFDEFFEETSVINRGIARDTSEGLYNRLEQITRLTPEKIFIMIGLNDIWDEIPCEETAENVRKICLELKKSLPDAEIYIQSVLPNLNETATEDILRLNEAYRSLCAEAGYTYIDLYNEFLDGGSIKKELFYDGTHITGTGYAIWTDKVKKYIDK